MAGSSYNQWPNAVLATLLAVTALNVGFTWYNLSQLSQLLPPKRKYSYIGHDHPDQLPIDLPEVGLVLTPDAEHFDLWNDTEWGALFPTSGFVPLPAPQNQTTFLISMTHQLHCLDVIRVGFLTNRTGAAEHVQHCLRYLRQAVLCYADTTLEEDEPAWFPEERRWRHGGSGVGSVHRCRDWTVVNRYLREHLPPPVDWPPPEEEGEGVSA
ncbi:hypothetical protein GLOTRDRAFT_137892 [Gloeophyllum trabeum ATCC 11539]|uniref:Uncharacterized protein n=1 Tax=Gloeophyllum trabeum (strain ATCC 11539 / FP-39264 / Madison 617) TaxID=670483 RepID=S7QCK9_GLOTA|nr:uncharacterized protein GLOTRDRAFT_137892 [Gloeophyllum trabeum ATCC 11539]EPQ57616.1 hypothetical protein GLOTRDRAFT_137892 [Gloeophyllum trabeum ATCC 11539]